MEVSGCSMVHNAHVYGLEESIRGAKFPMAVDVDKLTTELTHGIKALAQSEPGSGHDQFLEGIIVQFDLKATNKFWVEAERYTWFRHVSSQSTMHRIAKFDLDKAYNEYVDQRMVEIMKELVAAYNENPSAENYLKILYSNPSGFTLTARMTTNYRQLKTIYRQRNDHRLKEWRTLCKWFETLPQSELITGAE
jgi:hypothetical protein